MHYKKEKEKKKNSLSTLSELEFTQREEHHNKYVTVSLIHLWFDSRFINVNYIIKNKILNVAMHGSVTTLVYHKSMFIIKLILNT